MNVPLFSRLSRWCSPTASGLTILAVALWIGGISLPTNVRAAQPNRSGDRVDNDVKYVNCSSSNKRDNSINTALASLDPSENNTIYVRGACNENVNITSFDRLTLIAQDGASITNVSGGTLPTISITDSGRVSIQGFTVNGDGNPNDQFAVINVTGSTVYFSGNTVQGGDSDDIDFYLGSKATFNGDVIQNAVGDGIFLGQNSTVMADPITIQGIAGVGAEVDVSSFLLLRGSLVQNNTIGITIYLNGTVRLAHTTITGNSGDGIDDIDHSTLVFGGGPSSITANGGVGILVKDLSFATIDGSPIVVTGNLGSEDVLCSPQFPATRGMLTSIGGGKTNCVEP
jgi:Right handed beta helix region